ncbi:hypothetical protein V6N13_081552 [Hibiscus sabdariffa]|uniref:Uncharacterized protein n=1 Tax=Hibiscus sabdariffa TaxID=183260 RepID=A0ABR2DDF3_9ROSI
MEVHCVSKRSVPSSLWKTMKRVFICFNPTRSSRRKQNVISATSSMNSYTGSRSPDHAYSAMNTEDRDENLKEMITYCNKSMNRNQ